MKKKIELVLLGIIRYAMYDTWVSEPGGLEVGWGRGGFTFNFLERHNISIKRDPNLLKVKRP